jgi:NAD(P)-dependent dehydrogenase (short-subunit alcohol dehydrogenase family)
VYVPGIDASHIILYLSHDQAAGGIGQGAANALAAAGATAVFFADIGLTRGRIAAEECKKYATNPPFQIFALHGDVADAASVEKMVQDVVEKSKQIDYLVHAAGVC